MALSDSDQRQRRSLLRFLTRQTRSFEEAEDILQDAYVRILAVVHPRNIDAIDRYVWRAATNVLIDHARLRRTRTRLSATLAAREAPFAPSAELTADAQERLARAIAVLSTLPPKCAQAFDLRIVQGLPFEAVGHAMHMSDRMAKTYVARTLQILREELDQESLRTSPIRRTRPRTSTLADTACAPLRDAPAPTPSAQLTPQTPGSAQVALSRCTSQEISQIQPNAPASTVPTSPPYPGGLAMQCPDATAILKALIEGREPHSHEPLPAGSVIHRAEVLRALLAGVAALEQLEVRTKRRAALPDNTGRNWTAEEEDALATAFKGGESPVVLAERHSRTVRAIEARLVRLGLLAIEERTTNPGFQ